MRVTNALNICLLVVVLAMCAASIGAYLVVSSLRAQLYVSDQADVIGQDIRRLDQALEHYRFRTGTEDPKSVRNVIRSVNEAIEHLNELRYGDAIAAELDGAIEPYADAFDNYVRQQEAKGRALEAMDHAVSSLREKAAKEAARIDEENRRAKRQAAQIESHQTRRFETANTFGEILVSISRMRQAATTFAVTGQEGAHRTVQGAISRIESAIKQLTSQDQVIADSRRFKVFNKWFKTYSELYERSTLNDRSDGQEQEQVNRLKKAAAPLQAEADRLHSQIKRDFRSAVDQANEEREKMDLAQRRSVQLAATRQSLQDVLTLVRLLGETTSIELNRLSDEMRDAVDHLKRDALNLNSMVAVAHTEQRSKETNAIQQVGIVAAIEGLHKAWLVAVEAAAGQQSGALAMSKAATDAEDIVQQAIRGIDRDFSRRIDGFMIVIMVGVLTFLISSLIGALLISRYITWPLTLITRSISNLAKGDLAVPVAEVRTGRDLKALADAAEIFRKSSLERIDLERAHSEKERMLVHQRANALEKSLRDEQEKMQLQRRFVAMVCHEFRTPLSIIDGQARGIRKRLDKLEPEAIAGRLDKVTTSVERLINLMESMLASSRLEAGTIGFDPETHDLQALVAEACSAQNELSPSHQIDVDIETLPRDYFGDSGLLRQVVVNLLSNAIKYSPDADRIKVRGFSDAVEIGIEVKDFGPGIPADEVPKLKTQFFRASTSTGIPGTGIGLHLVSAFLEMHGGKLTITSIVGEGSAFSVHLPHKMEQLAA